MKILHLCWGLSPNNGAANIARLLMREQQAAGHAVELKSRPSLADLRAADQVWCHCGWYWVFWLVALYKSVSSRAAFSLHWLPEACYDPVRLAYHGWKKRLVGGFERRALRQADELVATCGEEARWIRDYVGVGCPPVRVDDLMRFFRFREAAAGRPQGARHLLYLGRPHPLKGTRYLEKAVDELNGSGPVRLELRMVSGHVGEELERDWNWCDALVLPTLTDNFGLVVAEALERGKIVVVTDGAPAWANEPRVTYVSGYREGSDERRVQLLRDALASALLV